MMKFNAGHGQSKSRHFSTFVLEIKALVDKINSLSDSIQG
jgi:hypothetical protein